MQEFIRQFLNIDFLFPEIGFLIAVFQKILQSEFMGFDAVQFPVRPLSPGNAVGITVIIVEFFPEYSYFFCGK